MESKRLLLKELGLVLAINAICTFIPILHVSGQQRPCTAHCANGVNDGISLRAVANQGSPCIFNGVDIGSESSNQGDYRRDSAELCQAYCVTRRHCQGISWYNTAFVTVAERRRCFIKEGRLPSPVARANAVTIYRTCTNQACLVSNVAYTIQAPVIAVGAAIPNINSAEQCQMQCAITDQCKHFTWSIITNSCQLLRGPDATAANRNAILGRAVNTVGSVSGTRSCYKCFQFNVNYMGVDLRIVTARSALHCQSICNDVANPTCNFFLFRTTLLENNCRLRQTVGTRIPEGGSTIAGPKCCCNPP